MAGTLTGLRVAILAARGVEQVELVQPRQAVTDAGATVELLSIEPGTVQATNHDLEPADEFEVDRVVSDVSIADYDALILPGGTVNPTPCAKTAPRWRSFVTSSRRANQLG